MRVATQHAHPADRFARETLAILERDTMRLQRLMRNPFGGRWNTIPSDPRYRSPIGAI